MIVVNHLNSVLLEGILVDDPKLIPLADPPDGVKLVKFDMASDRFYLNKDGEKSVETVFIPVQCWGKLGERCLEKLKKGMTCRTVGRLRLSRWMANDGSSRKSIEIVSQHLEFRIPKTKSKVEILEDRDNEADTARESEVIYAF